MRRFLTAMAAAATLSLTLAASAFAAHATEHTMGPPSAGDHPFAGRLHAVGAAVGTDLTTCRVSSAKFPSPSRPGDRVEIQYSTAGAKVALVASVAGRTVLKAEIACDAKPTTD